MLRSILSTSLLTLSLIVYGQSANVKRTQEYFAAYEAADFDLMGSYWHDSVMLQDFIVGELYQIDDTYYGAETVLKLWKQAFSVKPNYIDITVRDQFESGNYVVTHLTLEISNRQNEKNVVTSGDMITVLKFKGDKIIEHHDYADYLAWGRQTRSQRLAETNVDGPQVGNLAIAEQYIAAYSSQNPKGMRDLYHDDIIFKDLTAKDTFKSDDFELEGKSVVFAFWDNILTASKAKYINVKINGMFYSASYVVLDTQFSMILPESWTGGKPNVLVSFPIKTILQIKDGKILKHYDFADYNTYNEQIKLQTGS